MRNILFAVLAAVASAKTVRKSSLVQWSNENIIFNDANPATKFEFKINYDFDFGYAIAMDQTPAAEDELGPAIIDNWIQFELWSDANIGFTLNLLGLHICQVNLNIEPFHIVPLWFSIYNTHPVRVLNADPLNLFTEMGYSLAVGNVQLQYAPSTILPDVSILDFILGNGPIVPTNVFNIPTDINDRTDAGWDYSSDIGDLKDDPYLYFDFLDWLLEFIQSPIGADGSYFTIDIFGDHNDLYF